MEERAGERRNVILEMSPLLGPLPTPTSWGEEEIARVLQEPRMFMNSNPALEIRFSPYGSEVLMTGLAATFNRVSWLLKLPNAALLMWDIVSENLFPQYRA